LCYNTRHESDAEFTCDINDTAWDGGTSDRARKPGKGCVLDLPQLLGRVARTPLQGGLQEMRILLELL